MCSSSHCSWVMTLSHILSVYPSEMFMVYQDLPTRTTGYKPYAGYILLIALFVNHNLDPIFRNIHGHPAAKFTSRKNSWRRRSALGGAYRRLHQQFQGQGNKELSTAIGNSMFSKHPVVVSTTSYGFQWFILMVQSLLLE